MGHIEGVSRHQSGVFPARLGDATGAAHPVRAIDALVDALDWAALSFTHVSAAATGRPG